MKIIKIKGHLRIPKQTRQWKPVSSSLFQWPTRAIPDLGRGIPQNLNHN